MTKIVVLNAGAINYDGKIDFSALGESVVTYHQTAADQFSTRVNGATVVVTKEMPMGASRIAALPDTVQLCVEAGTGYNNYDLAALRDRGIALANVPAYSTDRVADTALMLMLNLASSMQVQLAMLAAGNHDNFTKHLMVPHIELNGKTLGVIGYGHIGRALIARAQAMRMKILVAPHTMRPDEPGVHFVTQADLLAQSDFVSLNLPLNDATHHLIDTDTLAMMKPSAFLINTARGGLVNTAALVAAIQAGQLAGAGLDVQEEEPLPDDSPLYDLPQVIVTPHIGWRGLETRQRLVGIVAADIQAFLAGQPINLVG